MSDDLLRDAFREVRERHDGAHHEPDVTLRRALLATRKRARTRSLTRFVLLPLAATLVASTVWAGATGRLGGAIHGAIDAVRGEHVRDETPSTRANTNTVLPRASAEATVASAAPIALAPATAPTAETPTAATSPAAPAAPSVTPTLSVVASTRPSAPAPPTELRAGAAADPNAALFSEAHRLHFVERDSARALDAWNAYLRAAPTGRFVPEARYNRALALVRLGRTGEAAQDLRAFAAGTYGEYRRDEARALLEAIERDARSDPE